jgi:hypothetical protein
MEDNVKPSDLSQRENLPPTRSRRFRLGLVYTAFAVAIVVAVVVVAYLVRSTGGLRATARLGPTGLVPGAGGDATLAQTTPGWRIQLEVTGLSRRDNGRYYYEAWLENAERILVPVGTFNQGPDVTLWAGVSPIDFPTLTVTEQQVGRSQASSGKRVLTGSVDVQH